MKQNKTQEKLPIKNKTMDIIKLDKYVVSLKVPQKKDSNKKVPSIKQV